ncbi:non-homologous end-joining DNA ligase [Paraburkholderia hospita]|uniref:non-homologous end-joining DNA ligase n=1 Tax=Paraburkholderia hospita TaxID=169430 RepID=UPI003ECDEC66
MKRNEPQGMPKVIEPQLATLAKRPPAHGDWSYEIKFDGYRMLARIASCDVRLVTRNGYNWTDRMPKLRDALDVLPVHDAWLDGEAVVLNAAGVPDFNALQNAFDRRGKGQIVLFLFDLLWMNRTDLRVQPLRDRRAALRELMDQVESPLLRFSDNFTDDPASIIESARKMKLEGIIGKRIDAPYRSGRSTSWIKLKCNQRQEFVVGGITRGKADIDSLLLGVFDPDGSLRYVGSVPPYFTSRQASAFFARAEAQEFTPFRNTPKAERGREYLWLKPVIVVEVSFREWTRGGELRHALSRGTRRQARARSDGRASH